MLPGIARRVVTEERRPGKPCSGNAPPATGRRRELGMKVFRQSLAIAALLSTSLGSVSAVSADTAQEVFICKLNEGKTMADLKKVIADFKQMIVKRKGGDKYQAWLLTPVAADDLSNIVWVGELPDGAALAALEE